MRPVVVDPAISFTQLAAELTQVGDDEARALVRDQFLAKLQRKRRHLSETAARDFETCAGMTPDAFIAAACASLPLADIAAWFARNPGLGEILDRKGEGPVAPIFISQHPDRLRGAEHGYGQAQRPEDYLAGLRRLHPRPGQPDPRPRSPCSPARGNSPANNCAKSPWSWTRPASARPTSPPPGAR